MLLWHETCYERFWHKNCTENGGSVVIFTKRIKIMHKFLKN